MYVKPTWKAIYPWIKEAVNSLDSLDSLLQEAAECLATVHQADCVVFAGMGSREIGTLKCYATPGAWHSLETWLEPNALTIDADDSTQAISDSPVRQFYLTAFPAWLSEQQETPHVTCLPTGELVVPVPSRGDIPTQPIATSKTNHNPLQLVLMLQRSPGQLQPSGLRTVPPTTEMSSPAEMAERWIETSCWSDAEIEAIQISCSQLGLAYSALYWRQRLEQSRQQSALVGRISRLLNSSLNPDEIVGRIVAELGQGLECDRCILVDLRHESAMILATWDHPNYHLDPLKKREIDRQLWQDAVEMFLQGGASYLQIEQADVDPDPLQVWLAELGAASVLIIPLFIQSEFFGAVALLSYQYQRIYQLDELQTVRQVADQAAIALTNAQHFQSLWHRQETLRMQNHSLQREVGRDDLTQLMNRRSLERELEQLSTVAVWSVQHTFSIVICDIDYFKLVNDTYGHLVGDEVLQILARRLQNQLRKDTPVYRYGGEEFVTILAETGVKKAIDVAERLRYAVGSSPIETSAGKIRITASFGVAQRQPDRDQNAWDIVHRADQALYEAKRKGRDRVNAS
jgi:diguanylate cyclase (GGDEF)-like protein